MPELPEMENYRRLLEEKIVGKQLTNVDVNREKSINMPTDLFQKQVLNKKLMKIERRSKHLIFHLNSGKSLLLHLMLGGLMYLGNGSDSPSRTKQVILSFGESELFFIGLRLGYLHLLTPSEISEKLSDLGPEPLDPSFTIAQFLQQLSGKHGMLKTTLLDQSFLSGIGNRYSDEICFEARLVPRQKVNDLNDGQQTSLYKAIGSVLRNAIHFGGYMSQPLYSGDDITGGYLSHFNVYKREGEPCKRCGETIIKKDISSRKSFYCPNCQKP